MAINEWVVRRGVFRAGFPNFHSYDYGDGRGTVYGHLLLGAAVASWRDVSRAELGRPGTPRERLAACSDYASAHGYETAFPNFHEADYGQGVVYGTVLIAPGTCEWRDVPALELGMAGSPGIGAVGLGLWGSPISWPLEQWFQSAHNYAVSKGFVGGLPTGNFAQYGGVWVCGICLLKPGTAEWRDIPGSELGILEPPTQAATPPQARPGEGSTGPPAPSVTDSAPPYEPWLWNDSGQVQLLNNCYNYGCDIATQTFAQPGRGGGSEYRFVSCPEVGRGAVVDGLKLTTSTGCGEGCHLVALVVFPSQDYHWYRRDHSGYWSHKPGSTKATELDNAGRLIIDPRTADRGPYSTFCGFFCVCKAQVRIA